MYRARNNGERDGRCGAFPTGQLMDGYLAILFPQDGGTLSTLIVRRDDDRQFAELRDPAAFEAAMQAIPLFAPNGPTRTASSRSRA